MIQAIKRTLIRLSGNIYYFNPTVWYPLLMEGLSEEIELWRQYKDLVYNSLIPNDNMDPGSIEDHNEKYGVPQNLGGTTQEQIDRIKSKAALNGEPGPDWLEQELQKQGFQLYVHESTILEGGLRQWGTFQYGTAGVQWGRLARYADPATTEGVLVVGSSVCGLGRLFLNQFGGFQWGGGRQWGTPDPQALDPQPCKYVISDDPSTWHIYFWLSPFDDRLAVDESEFLTVESEKLFNYLQDQIIEIKGTRSRCILQAKVG